MVLKGFELTGILFKTHLVVLLASIIGLFFVTNKLRPLLAVISVVTISIITSWIAVTGITTNGLELNIYGGSFIGNIPLRIDALSAWFMLIINFITTTGVIYGIGYLKVYKSQHSIETMHWVLFVLFQSSMLWVCMIQNSIAFLIVWEVMSLSSLLLVLFDHTNPQVLKAGINYMVQMHLSVIFLTVAFIWVYFKTGTFDFKGIGLYFGSNVNIWLFIVFFIGFGFKAGFIGLHTWLPYAHPAAPSHVSGVMSGVIVKMGIYGIFRIISFLQADYILLGEVVLILSLLTGLFGIMNAAVHRDFKKMLAYCTIENIGIIGIGIGLGLIGMGKGQSLLYYLGFGGALLHVLNHSLFKSLLFYSAGSVYQQTHTRDMDQLGGLIKKMPQTALIFLIGAIAIGGIPPFNGFISEFLIYCGLLDGMHSAGIAKALLMVLSFAGMSIIGGISILTFTKAFGTIFLGTSRQNLHHEPQEVSILMLIPQYITVAVMLAVAFIPGFFLRLVGILLEGRFASNVQMDSSKYLTYLPVLSKISLYFFLFLVVIGLIFVIRLLVTRKHEEKYAPTWGCGYLAPNTRMQYTGKSFSKTLGKILGVVVTEKKKYTELTAGEIFPQTRNHSSHYIDFFESNIFDAFINRLIHGMSYFGFIQNGRIQMYVLYGVFFILLIFLGTSLGWI